MKKVPNKLRVVHFPQIPCKPFCVDVIDEYDAYRIINILAKQHLFLFEENIIPDYANVITVEMWAEDDEPGWNSYWNDEECAEWNEIEEEISVEQIRSENLSFLER